MESVLILLKILIYSVLGYYILGFLSKKRSPFVGVISPVYGLFSFTTIFTSVENIPLLFIIGILWGYMIENFMGSINEELKTNINILWFGLLNILNYHILDGLIEKFIISSSLESIIFLFIFGLSYFLIDLAISMRRLL